jgi:GNAT superfamily N-acetyltransferase
MIIPQLIWLDQTHTPQITEHLTSLLVESLRSRFRTTIDNYGISKYVAQINFSEHVVVGFFHNSTIITLVHMAPYVDGGWELAISVAEGYRGLGLAGHILERLKPIAAEKGWRRLSVLYDANNTAVAKLCSRAGLSRRWSGTECEGVWEPDAATPEDTRTLPVKNSFTKETAL